MLSDQEMLQRLVTFYDKDAKRQNLDLNGRWNEIAKRYKELRSRPEEQQFARATSFREAVEQVEPRFKSMISPELTALIQADGVLAQAAVPSLPTKPEAGSSSPTSSSAPMPLEKECSPPMKPDSWNLWHKIDALEQHVSKNMRGALEHVEIDGDDGPCVVVNLRILRGWNCNNGLPIPPNPVGGFMNELQAIYISVVAQYVIDSNKKALEYLSER